MEDSRQYQGVLACEIVSRQGRAVCGTVPLPGVPQTLCGLEHAGRVVETVLWLFAVIRSSNGCT